MNHIVTYMYIRVADGMIPEVQIYRQTGERQYEPARYVCRPTDGVTV